MVKNDDLFAIKKSNTGTELNILEAQSLYKKLEQYAEAIPLPETNHMWNFLVGKNKDLVAIKKSDTYVEPQNKNLCAHGSLKLRDVQGPK